ncbi:MAG: hypothetical protein ACTSSE_01985 [Candidatus Thorarchaeota archaeon]
MNGCKAEGAAQGYTVLGGIVLLIFALQRIVGGLNSPYDIIEIFLGIAVIIFVVLSFDASGFVTWKLKRSGLLLALFGFFLIVITSYGVITLNIIAWLSSLPTLCGTMILIGGLIMAVNKG